MNLMDTLQIRKFRLEDINQVLKIYNFHIKNGFGNFQEKILSYEEFFDLCQNILKEDLPFLVSESDKKIIGFTYLYKFRNKSGYRFSFENSIYIDNKFIGMGIGNKLLNELIKNSKQKSKIKTIIAVISGHNSIPSIKIHEKNGFIMIGILKKIGFKNNKWLDSIYMQKIIHEKD